MNANPFPYWQLGMLIAAVWGPLFVGLITGKL